MVEKRPIGHQQGGGNRVCLVFDIMLAGPNYGAVDAYQFGLRMPKTMMNELLKNGDRSARFSLLRIRSDVERAINVDGASAPLRE